ncbi:MAG: BspA family leucine-rich repeat surface protein, partial [Mollicutes bacterium]|nr:BspA family leucine-rich repeat surface protein [Mollicutes bacterium]
YSQSPTTGYIILNDEYLFAGTSKTYNLYVWVDYGEDGVNNSQMNKTFEGIVAITDSVVYNRQGLYALLNQQKANILTLPKLSTTIGSPIIVLSKNQGIDVNNVTNIYSVDLHKARPDYQNTNMAFFADVDDEDVIATWTEGNNFFIGERNQVRPGPSMQSAFSTANFYYHECNLVRVELFNFNTSKVTNMKNMFSYTGNNSNEFTLNLGKHFNTSNVTDMSYMFCATGNYSSSFTLDLGKHFNTSKATNMTLMFDGTGRHSSSFTLDLGFHFNTSKVTTMYRMFSNFCEKCQTLNLDLGLHFNTSRVSDMHAMFENAGNLATNFTLNLNSFVINNSAVNISNLGLNSGASTIIIGGGWGNANSTQLDNNFFLLKKPTLVYANSTFHSYRIGNKTMWDRWKGTGNTTFILNLP